MKIWQKPCWIQTSLCLEVRWQNSWKMTPCKLCKAPSVKIYNSKKHSRTICHLAKHLLKLCHCWKPLCAALMVLGIWNCIESECALTHSGKHIANQCWPFNVQMMKTPSGAMFFSSWARVEPCAHIAIICHLQFSGHLYNTGPKKHNKNMKITSLVGF